MAKQSQETRLMREFVSVTSRGEEPHPELLDEMARLGILRPDFKDKALKECLAILHENRLGTYQNLVA